MEIERNEFLIKNFSENFQTDEKRRPNPTPGNRAINEHSSQAHERALHGRQGRPDTAPRKSHPEIAFRLLARLWMKLFMGILYGIRMSFI